MQNHARAYSWGVKRLAFLILVLHCGPAAAQVLTPRVSQRPPVPVRYQNPVNNPDICRGTEYYYGIRRSWYVASSHGPALQMAGNFNYGTNLEPRPGYRSPELSSYRSNDSSFGQRARRSGDSLNSRKRKYKTLDLKNLR